MSGIRNGAIIQYDERGDLVIRIPKRLVRRFEENLLSSAIEQLLPHPPLKEAAKTSWADDPILRTIAICDTGLRTGSTDHDSDIYGDSAR